MQFSSVRLVTNEFESLVSFYARLSGVEATRLADGFAEVRLDGATLAISEERLVQRFNAGAATAAANRSAILEFEVADVLEVYARLKDTAPIVMQPTLMPWGNHSLLIRDPDGNLVNVFSRPAAQQA